MKRIAELKAQQKPSNLGYSSHTVDELLNKVMKGVQSVDYIPLPGSLPSNYALGA